MASIFHGHPAFMGVKVKQDKLLYIYCVQGKLYSSVFFLSFFCPRCWIPCCFLLRYRRLGGSRNKTSCDGSLLLGNGEISSLNGERLRSEREGRMGFDVLRGVFLVEEHRVSMPLLFCSCIHHY